MQLSYYLWSPSAILTFIACGVAILWIMSDPSVLSELFLEYRAYAKQSDSHSIRENDEAMNSSPLANDECGSATQPAVYQSIDQSGNDGQPHEDLQSMRQDIARKFTLLDQRLSLIESGFKATKESLERTLSKLFEKASLYADVQTAQQREEEYWTTYNREVKCLSDVEQSNRRLAKSLEMSNEEFEKLAQTQLFYSHHITENRYAAISYDKAESKRDSLCLAFENAEHCQEALRKLKDERLLLQDSTGAEDSKGATDEAEVNQPLKTVVDEKTLKEIVRTLVAEAIRSTSTSSNTTGLQGKDATPLVETTSTTTQDSPSTPTQDPPTTPVGKGTEHKPAPVKPDAPPIDVIRQEDEPVVNDWNLMLLELNGHFAERYDALQNWQTCHQSSHEAIRDICQQHLDDLDQRMGDFGREAQDHVNTQDPDKQDAIRQRAAAVSSLLNQTPIETFRSSLTHHIGCYSYKWYDALSRVDRCLFALDKFKKTRCNVAPHAQTICEFVNEQRRVFTTIGATIKHQLSDIDPNADEARLNSQIAALIEYERTLQHLERNLEKQSAIIEAAHRPECAHGQIKDQMDTRPDGHEPNPDISVNDGVPDSKGPGQDPTQQSGSSGAKKTDVGIDRIGSTMDDVQKTVVRVIDQPPSGYNNSPASQQSTSQVIVIDMASSPADAAMDALTQQLEAMRFSPVFPRPVYPAPPDGFTIDITMVDAPKSKPSPPPSKPNSPRGSPERSPGAGSPPPNTPAWPPTGMRATEDASSDETSPLSSEHDSLSDTSTILDLAPPKTPPGDSESDAGNTTTSPNTSSSARKTKEDCETLWELINKTCSDILSLRNQAPDCVNQRHKARIDQWDKDTQGFREAMGKVRDAIDAIGQNYGDLYRNMDTIYRSYFDPIRRDRMLNPDRLKHTRECDPESFDRRRDRFRLMYSNAANMMTRKTSCCQLYIDCTDESHNQHAAEMTRAVNELSIEFARFRPLMRRTGDDGANSDDDQVEEFDTEYETTRINQLSIRIRDTPAESLSTIHNHQGCDQDYGSDTTSSDSSGHTRDSNRYSDNDPDSEGIGSHEGSGGDGSPDSLTLSHDYDGDKSDSSSKQSQMSTTADEGADEHNGTPLPVTQGPLIITRPIPLQPTDPPKQGPYSTEDNVDWSDGDTIMDGEAG